MKCMIKTNKQKYYCYELVLQLYYYTENLKYTPHLKTKVITEFKKHLTSIYLNYLFKLPLQIISSP